jgi:hypothetical protein
MDGGSLSPACTFTCHIPLFRLPVSHVSRQVRTASSCVRGSTSYSELPVRMPVTWTADPRSKPAL